MCSNVFSHYMVLFMIVKKKKKHPTEVQHSMMDFTHKGSSFWLLEILVQKNLSR